MMRIQAPDHHINKRSPGRGAHDEVTCRQDGCVVIGVCSPSPSPPDQYKRPMIISIRIDL